MYDERYDMHITFYGDSVNIESINNEVDITLPKNCDIDELSDLLRTAVHILISKEASE